MSTTATTATALTTPMTTIERQKAYDKLSTTRKSIIAYTAKGQTEKQLAVTLGLAYKTIKFHKTEIFKLLQLPSNSAELVSIYYQLHSANSGEAFKSELETVRLELFNVAAERDELAYKLQRAEARILFLERSAGVLPFGSARVGA